MAAPKVLPRRKPAKTPQLDRQLKDLVIENANLREAVIQVGAEVERLTAELREPWNVCGWCGWNGPRGNLQTPGPEIVAHLAVCEKRPRLIVEFSGDLAAVAFEDAGPPTICDSAYAQRFTREVPR